MIYLFKPLPVDKIDISDWKTFREPIWIKKNFMKFVYILQVILILTSVYCGVWNMLNFGSQILIFVLTFILHELLHIIIVCRLGDVSLTYHVGIFLWLTPSAVMTKKRYLLYMVLPFTILTLSFSIIGFFMTGITRDIFIFIA